MVISLAHARLSGSAIALCCPLQKATLNCTSHQTRRGAPATMTMLSFHHSQCCQHLQPCRSAFSHPSHGFPWSPWSPSRRPPCSWGPPSGTHPGRHRRPGRRSCPGGLHAHAQGGALRSFLWLSTAMPQPRLSARPSFTDSEEKRKVRVVRAFFCAGSAIFE